MKSRIVRIVVTAFAVEILTVMILVLAVAIFGPSDPAAAEAYAKDLGYWVGPIGGFVMCLLGGWWVAKGLETNHIMNGLLLGVTVAVIDITILIASSEAFQTVFVISNIGRVIAGTIGGYLASRSVTGAFR